MTEVRGLHHITAIAGDAQRNYDFYSGVLGLRLVKHTVNFDDPGSLHLYYGDGLGSPGTLLTFFPWERGAAGLRGVHQAGSFALRVPLEALGYWLERFIEKGISYKGPTRVVTATGNGSTASAQSLQVSDPDGIDITLIAGPGSAGAAATASWAGAPVPAEYAVQGIHAVQLWLLKSEPTIQLLEFLGYRRLGDLDNLTTMGAPSGSGLIEVRETGQFLQGREGVGTVHHVALSVADDDALERLGAAVVARGLEATEVRERLYFRSIYFREPGGVLLELATVGPGFTVDESVEELGSALRFPPQYEKLRTRLELTLPPLHREPGGW